jgi:PST family polysaccharide transporter
VHFRNFLSFLFKNKTASQTVAKNTVWLSISNVCGRLLKAVVIIYAVRVLDPAGWGVFSYAVTLAGFFTFFADPGVNIMLIREGSKKDNAYTAKLLSTAFYIKIILIIATVLFVLFVTPFFTTLPGAKILLPIVALIVIGDTLREFFSSYIRAKEKMEREAAIFLITNVCIVVFGFVALSFMPTAVSFGWAYAAGTTVGALLALWVLRAHIKKLFSEFSAKLVIPILRSAWPFAITGALGLLLTNMDILIISWMRSASDVGIYSAAVRIIQVLYLFPVIIQYSTLPVLSRLAKQDSEKFRRTLEQVVTVIFSVSIPIVFGGAILGTEIMRSVFGPAYVAGGMSLSLLMFSMLVDYPGGVISLAIFAYDRQKILINASIIGGVTNVVLDLILIPRYGITGSAVATLVAQILNNGYLWYVMKKVNYFEILPKLKNIMAAGVIMAVVTSLLAVARTNVILNVVLSIVVYVAALNILHEPLIGEITKLMKSSHGPEAKSIEATTLSS